MGTALRALGFVVFVAALAGATYGAYQVFPPEDSFSAVQLEPAQEGPSAVLAGTPTPIQFTAKNLGEANVTLDVRSDTEGYTFTSQSLPTTLRGNQSRTVRGMLTVPADLLGSHQVRLQAFDNATGNRIGSLRLPLNVSEPLPPKLTLTTSIPAVVPGQEVQFQVTVENPAAALQRFHFELTRYNGSVEPASLQLPAGQTQSITVTTQVPEAVGDSFEPQVLAGNEAGREVTGDFGFRVVSAGQFVADPVFPSFEVSPGNDYSIPVTVVSNIEGNDTIEVTGANLVAHNLDTAPRGQAVGGFITLTAPEDLSGEQQVDATLTIGEVSQPVAAVVHPPTGDTVAGDEHNAQVNYVGRLTTGEIFDTSFTAIAQGPFPKADTFRARPGLAPITVPLDPTSQRIIPGFQNAVRGLEIGETQTAVIPPSEAYGPARVHENISATTELQRVEEVPRVLEDFPKQQLPPAFDIENREVGDVITYDTQAGGVPVTFRFRVQEIAETTVTLQRMEAVGDKTTFYPPWPNATEVIEVSEQTITFRTTPPEDLGNFTWNVNPQSHAANWGEVTTVGLVNETAIVLQHNPQVDTTYQMATRPGAPPQTYTIEGVTEENVHVSSPNPSPLGGKTLIFDMYVVELQQAPQQPQGQMPGGR